MTIRKSSLFESLFTGMVVDRNLHGIILSQVYCTMHELSIATSIVEIVEHHVPDGRPVRCVKVKVGAQSGVVPDSLSFCFSAIVVGSPLEGVCLEIERVPFTLTCQSCGLSFESVFGTILCPACASRETLVVSGTELYVDEIELADDIGEIPGDPRMEAPGADRWSVCDRER